MAVPTSMPYVDEAQPSAAANDDHLTSLDEVRRRHVTLVLEHCNGNRTNAAKILHLDRKTLYRKLVRWGLASK
jgi:two-component system, NtrC family, response regulator AtoC